MPTRLRRWLVAVLAAAVFAPALATLWVELHVARHHEGAGHHHDTGHHDTGHHDTGHHHETGHDHAAGHHHEADHHHDTAQRHETDHRRNVDRSHQGVPHHHVTPDPRHEPAARRGLVTAAVGLAWSALPAVVASPPPVTPRSPSLVRPHRGPPPPLFASHCALLL